MSRRQQSYGLTDLSMTFCEGMIIHKYSIHIGYMWSKDHQPIGCVALLLVYLKNSWWAVITEIPFKGVIFHSPLKKPGNLNLYFAYL